MKASLYTTYLDTWKQGLVCAGFSPRLPDFGTRFWFEQLEKALPDKVGAFLDIGAGDGRLSLLLFKTWGAGVALEVQVDQNVWGNIKKQAEGIELREGLLQNTMNDLVGRKTFNFIVLSEVFEHIPLADVPPFLKTLHSLLADDGIIFLTTPNYVVQGPAEKSSMWHGRQPYGHHKHYALAELAALFGDYCFIVQSHCFECHTIKKLLYNRCFYPLSRFDGRVIASCRLPRFVKDVYRWLSAPLVFGFKVLFRHLAWLVYYVEKNWSKEHNGSTIIMSIKKIKSHD